MAIRSLVLLAFLAIPALAQAPRGFFAWWDSPIARDLNLTDSQVRQIRTTVREYRPQLVDLRAAIEKAEIEVEDAFNEENIDQRKATEAIDHLANARADLTRAISQMSLRLRSVLTPDQWRELQKRRPLRQGNAAPKKAPGR